MSYYDSQAWPNSGRQPTWEQPAPPTRSAGASSAVQRDESVAFSSQFEEVDRAVDNLVKSGKLFGPSRRDSMPVMGGPRPYPDFDPRMAAQLPQRHHSVSEFDPMRSHSATNLQSFYATQRFQSRPSEAEQMMQVKRKMAAQRERELRNYHQEQQYNRTILAEISNHGKPDRVMSPSAMSEDERRELIARQHRALYNTDTYSENSVFGDESNTPRPIGVVAGTGIPTSTASSSGVRGQSPLAFDPFGISQSQAQNGSVENSGQSSAVEQTQGQGQGQQATGTGPSPIQQRSRANSASSPSSKSASFSLFDNTGVNQQSSRTSTSSPGGSPPRQAARTSTTPVGVSVAPIGTRPSQSSQSQVQNSALNKRSTTPLPSPLSFGFAAGEDSFGNNNVSDRSGTATSSNTAGAHESGVGLGWGSKSGVWGNKNSLGVQASVWG